MNEKMNFKIIQVLNFNIYLLKIIIKIKINKKYIN